MLRVGRRDTAPELAIRRLLFARGLRYQVDRRPIAAIRRRADLVFHSAWVAVYIDGCFWHACPEHGTWPKNNSEFWRNKIEANERRDRDTDRELLAKGWRVIRVWEHEDPRRAAERIACAVRARAKLPLNLCPFGLPYQPAASNFQPFLWHSRSRASLPDAMP